MNNTIVIQWPAVERIRVVTRNRITALPDMDRFQVHFIIFISICRILYAVVKFDDNVYAMWTAAAAGRCERENRSVQNSL